MARYRQCRDQLPPPPPPPLLTPPLPPPPYPSPPLPQAESSQVSANYGDDLQQPEYQQAQQEAQQGQGNMGVDERSATVDDFHPPGQDGQDPQEQLSLQSQRNQPVPDVDDTDINSNHSNTNPEVSTQQILLKHALTSSPFISTEEITNTGNCTALSMYC